jgi:hypothetical protein
LFEIGEVVAGGDLETVNFDRTELLAGVEHGACVPS